MNETWTAVGELSDRLAWSFFHSPLDVVLFGFGVCAALALARRLRVKQHLKRRREALAEVLGGIPDRRRYSHLRDWR